MNKDFEKCLASRRIVPQEHVANFIPRELKDSLYDLEKSKQTFELGDYKWATIKAYYSMFHAARALLFAKGYREKGHVCLKYAIQALYVDEGLLDQNYIDDFDTTMLLRETADYKSDFSKEGAETAIANAETFLIKTKEIIES